MRWQSRTYPFAALVGQDEVKQALVLLAVNPRLNGLLIRGEKGTAKSTAARGLASLLPAVQRNEGCRFGCAAARPRSWCDECVTRSPVPAVPSPPGFETLPLGITEDQLLGTMDLEQALKHGEKRFAPGLLARVNHGVLYVDEVNLLDDHIVDLLLDCAASGVNVVAREGVAIAHPADFLLVGTMNPEEGEIRPQLLDRFGLCVDIQGVGDPEVRAEIVERTLAFERDPEGFTEIWAEATAALSRTIAAAREKLAGMVPARRWLRAAALLSVSLGVDGHRADILMAKAAATLAAVAGRDQVEATDFEVAATFVYPHRLRRRPFEEAAMGAREIAARAREVAADAAGREYLVSAAAGEKKKALTPAATTPPAPLPT
ncbi:MAG: ATP-binding protein [Candidatus Schekmanbacteria bacterium]|nr:ATP-binding protein [Candidatus Schekmanbacteria bacterium]